MTSITHVIDFGNAASADNLNASWEDEETADPTVKLAHLYLLPWYENVSATTSSTIAGVTYQGSGLDTITETVEIVEGKGRVGKPFTGLVSSSYGSNTNLGAVSVTAEGDVTTATPGNSLLTITYTSRRHTWRVSASVVNTDQDRKVQLIATITP